MTAPVKEIEVQDLRLAYDSREVLHGVSFDVYRGEILSVIGPAQSGKSSLLRFLNRTTDFVATARVSGSIRVGGENVLAEGRVRDRKRHRLGDSRMIQQCVVYLQRKD